MIRYYFKDFVPNNIILLKCDIYRKRTAMNFQDWYEISFKDIEMIYASRGNILSYQNKMRTNHTNIKKSLFNFYFMKRLEDVIISIFERE